MAHYPGERDRGIDRQEAFLKYAGIAGLAIGLLLTVAVLALTVAPALIPSGPALATALFTGLLAVVALATRQFDWLSSPEIELDEAETDLPNVRDGD